jgi:hypothetical protein
VIEGRTGMRANRRRARTAGAIYLVVALTGIFSLAYVPAQIHVPGDVHATVDKIVALKSLFRLGILSELIQYTLFLPLAFALYRLLRNVNKSVAVAMVTLVAVSIPIAFSAVANKMDVLSLLSDDKLVRALTTDQLDTQVRLLLDSYSNTILLCEIFWGLWLFPFGYLVFKSGVLPKALGVLLMVGCFSYLFDFVAGFTETAIPSLILLPASIGEIGTCLWLLVVGAKPPVPGEADVVSPAT